METLDQLIAARKEKLAAFREAGMEPYPYEFDRDCTVEQFLHDFESLEAEQTEVRMAGRVVAKRVMGKASFAHFLDDTGRVQFYVRRDDVGEDTYKLYKSGVQIGDWVGLTGTAMVTKTGEKTLHVTAWTLLAKNIRPLPVVKEDADTGEKHHAFSDTDERYRNRALDLIVNPEERSVFRTRARVIAIMRRILDEEGFLEVETPALQPLYGGGTARPFETHHNQLKKKLYLRIADELYLKRLIVGGLDRVFEIAKDFRNEGVDRTHNPEFTMMECYVAFKDYHYHMDLVERIVSSTAKEIHGEYVAPFNSEELDYTPPWPRVKFFGALQEATGEDLLGADLETIRKVAKAHNVELDPKYGVGKALDELFSELVEPTFTRPTFVVDYPIELSPLAKKHRDDPRLVERFEAFAGGMEIANSFSELTDPQDQRERFEAQAKARAAGDDEAMQVDEDFLGVLELGMPPTAGLGLGVDRLVMLMTDRGSIRDVVLFPLLRDRIEGDEEEGVGKNT